jgi:hypothetical protein
LLPPSQTAITASSRNEDPETTLPLLQNFSSQQSNSLSHQSQTLHHASGIKET